MKDSKKPITKDDLRRPVVRQILLAHRGECRALAIKLGVQPKMVSMVLHGLTTSKRVMDACVARAHEIRQQEASEAA